MELANLPVEQSIIGACLRTPQVLYEVRELIQPEDLALEHARILEAMLTVDDLGQPVDMLTVQAELQKNGYLPAIGGSAYLAECYAKAAASDKVEPYARIVQGLSFRRRGIEFAEAAQKMLATEKDEQAIMQFLETQVLSLYRQSGRKTIFESPESSAIGWQHLMDIKAGKRSRGASTGFPSLDAYVRLIPGKLYLIGGYSGYGKTTAACQIMRNVAANEIGCLFESLEMDIETLMQREYSALSGIPLDRVQNPASWTQDETERIEAAKAAYETLPITIDHPESDLTPTDLRMRIVRYVEGKRRAGLNVGLVVIDYLQWMVFTEKKVLLYKQMGDCIKMLKRLAERLGVAIIVLTQLTEHQKGGKKGEEKAPPSRDNLRESQDITQHADVVMLLDWLCARGAIKGYADMTGRAKNEAARQVSVIYDKNRLGPTGNALILWSRATGSYEEPPYTTSF